MKNENEITKIAHAAADCARDVILPYFRTPFQGIENKQADGFDPVTLADKASEKAMRQLIISARPDDGIWGEEFGKQEGTSGWQWVLDPIDGTRGFISGTPCWGVLIGVNFDDKPVFGLIDQPYIGERFWGGFGRAHSEGPGGQHQLTTSKTADLSDAILFSTFPEIGTVSEANAFNQVKKCVRLTRYGLDCYAYALLALGQIDLIVEAGLNAYDIQAPIALIEAAGGVVTNWQGGRADQGGQVLAAANTTLHAQALEKLQHV